MTVVARDGARISLRLIDHIEGPDGAKKDLLEVLVARDVLGAYFASQKVAGVMHPIRSAPTKR